MNGFQVVDLMTEHDRYSTEHLLSNIMEPLLRATSANRRKTHSHRLNPHIDNHRVHCSKSPDVLHSKITVFERHISPTVLLQAFHDDHRSVKWQKMRGENRIKYLCTLVASVEVGKK
jgi:hypothetical protein